MTRRNPWVSVLVRNPLLIPGAAWLAGEALVRSTLRDRSPRIAAAGDPEDSLHQDRCNAVISRLREADTSAALALLVAVCGKPEPAQDTYSCAQRIANAALLARSGIALPEAVHKRLRLDAAQIMRNPEYKRSSTWFNNHLLNDLRGLVLYRAHFSAGLETADVDGAIARMEGWLLRDLTTLFRDGRGPILNEGSVSYEILVLSRIFDVAMAGPPSPLVQLFRSWLGDNAVTAMSQYRKGGAWLLPEIGDITPDWERADALAFLDGVFLGKNTIYRRAWGRELDALGYSSPAAMPEFRGASCAE